MNRPSPQDLVRDDTLYLATLRLMFDARRYHTTKHKIPAYYLDLQLSRWLTFNMASHGKMGDHLFGMKIIYQPLLRSYFRIVPPAHTYTLQPDGSYVVT